MVTDERLMQRLNVQRLVIDQQNASRPRLRGGKASDGVTKSARPQVHEFTSANS